MRKIIHWVNSSVDGYVDGPNEEFDWAQLGPELGEYADRLHKRADTFLFGRKVWDMMAGYWPNAEETAESEHDLKFAPIWLETPKIVFSRTLEKADWNTRVISGNLAEEVSELKRQPGKDMLLTGGSELPAALTALGLVDEYHIAVHPVVLGGGRPLFQEPERRVNLRLVEARPADSRTVILHYQPTTEEG
ncbi:MULTISPECIES: dihydrofolate reductase family protein [unclassified Micromonospora]|uniref:dihydrofolate reductase family protein n=1 Tax=unclassified Micromonospora TaxID=2617518 RepID=UPI003A84F579